MRKLVPILILFAACSYLCAEPSPAPVPSAPSIPVSPGDPVADAISKSVVKIFSTQADPDPYKPWTKAFPAEYSGSGIVIDGNRILTNAHLTNYSRQIQVQDSQGGDKISATLLATSVPDDLSLLQLDDNQFFNTHPPISRASTLPDMRDSVTVYGFPLGGDGLSITKGIVSRIEVISSLFGSGLRIQIDDAAINPGNSGGAGDCWR